MDDGNIAWRAADRFLRAFEIQASIRIRIEKRIPIGAGLGGGSSNGSTVLKALGSLFKVDDSADSDSVEGAKPGTVETSAAVEAARVEDKSALANEPSEGQEEAKRFARLLLSEIKLYNEQEVALAQQDNKVYERLREDIDRSWEMYSERVSDQVSDKQPLFYQELVAILAKGDELVLGNSPYRA